MLDLPQQTLEKPRTEIEYFVAKAGPAKVASPCKGCKLSRDVTETDPLYQQAESMVAVMKDGFQWQDVTSIIRLAFNFVQHNQALTFEQQKEQVTTLLGYIIDLTDTAYLPDSFTDPLFKALMPPIIDTIGRATTGQMRIIPTISTGASSSETFKNFAAELQATYADGWQWSDLGSYLQSTLAFVCSFASLTKEQQKAAVIDIINVRIDAVDMPYIPDNLVDPILKSMMPPLVSLLFDEVMP